MNKYEVYERIQQIKTVGPDTQVAYFSSNEITAVSQIFHSMSWVEAIREVVTLESAKPALADPSNVALIGNVLLRAV